LVANGPQLRLIGKEGFLLTITEQTRFAKLRDKTDRELAVLLHRRLHSAVAGQVSGAGSRAEAEEAYTEAGAVIPLIYHLPLQRREHLEGLRAQLGALLADELISREASVGASC
jgi:hypothetical protein